MKVTIDLGEVDVEELARVLGRGDQVPDPKSTPEKPRPDVENPTPPARFVAEHLAQLVASRLKERRRAAAAAAAAAQDAPQVKARAS